MELLGICIVFGIPVFAIASAVFILLWARGKNRVVVIVGESVLFGVIALLFLISSMTGSYRNTVYKDCGSAEGGLLSSVHYKGTENGYHLFVYSKLFGYDLLAVSAQYEKPALLSSALDDAVIYYRGELRSDERVFAKGEEWTVVPEPAGIEPDLSRRFIDIGIIDGGVLLLFNFIEIFVVIGQKAEKNKEETLIPPAPGQ